MSAFDAVAQVVGTCVICAVGRVTGRAFDIERDRAMQVGQWLVVGALAVGGFALCLVYT